MYLHDLLIRLGTAIALLLPWLAVPDGSEPPAPGGEPEAVAAPESDPAPKADPAPEADPVLARYEDELAAMPAGVREGAVRYLRQVHEMRTGTASAEELRQVRADYLATAEPNVFRTGAAIILADAAGDNGDLAEAERLLRSVAAPGGPGAIQASIELAEVLLRRGDAVAARRQLIDGPHLGRGEIRDGSDALQHNQRARLLFKTGDSDAARLAFLEGTPDPESPGATAAYMYEGSVLAGILGLVGRDAAGAANFQATLITKYPGHVTPLTLRTLRVTLRAAGLKEAAEEAREAARERFPNSDDAAALLVEDADAAFQARDFPAAELLARKVLERTGATESVKRSARQILSETLDPAGSDRGEAGPAAGTIAPQPDPRFTPPDGDERE